MLGKNLIQAAAGAGAGGDVLGVEDVFSTWLYTGTGSTQTITNGIDLAGEGGLVWIKARQSAYEHRLVDTERGATFSLESNSPNPQSTESNGLTAFNNDGFSLGDSYRFNGPSQNYASWTFRKAEKLFDVITWTGNSVNGRTISHNLGSTPGCIIVKNTNLSGGSVENWYVWHRSISGDDIDAPNNLLRLNITNALFTGTKYLANAQPTTFTVGNAQAVNTTGNTYVAYLFAHDAGGFGDGGTESVIKCGSFTATAGGLIPTVELGWEPQWLLIKASSEAGQWYIFDNMRGIATGGSDAYLMPSAANAEQSGDFVSLTPTGFSGGASALLGGNATYIYIAIRRGPMKTPTDATEVFSAQAYTGVGAAMTRTTNFVVDQVFATRKDFAGSAWHWWDRIRGGTKYLQSASTATESTFDFLGLDSNTSYTWKANDGFATGSGLSYINYALSRAPGFFDVVAYTGDGTTNGSYTVNHNLGVVPEFIVVKNRQVSSQWPCYHKDIPSNFQLQLNRIDSAAQVSTTWNPQILTFSPQIAGNSEYNANNNNQNYIAYLFASCPGVSKVGSYTGTGTTLNIDCGFTNGSRLVLIKRTDSTGDWYVWDTARGIVSGNDPYLLLNSTAAEVTSTDYIDPLSSGFQISSTAPAAINASGGSYIYLSVA